MSGNLSRSQAVTDALFARDHDDAVIKLIGEQNEYKIDNDKNQTGHVHK